MATLKLTAAVVKRLTTDKAREDFHDAVQRGLHLRIYASGRKVWRMRYRWRGKRPILTLGEYPAMSLSAARRAVMDAHERIAEGYDPAADAQREHAKRQQMPTAAEFAEEYIERHAKPNKKTWAVDRRTLDKDILPYMGKLMLDEVHRRDIVAVIDRVRDRGANTHANRVYAVVRKMFNFAVERGVLDISPAQQVKLTKERRREDVLTDADIKVLWTATEPYGESDAALPMHHTTRHILRLLLLTGARNSEVCGIRLAELDLNRQLWTLPGDRAKNSMAYTVPLSNTAMATIEAAMETADDTFLFPSNSKSGHATSYAPIQAMKRLFEGGYRPHDLRRTAATRITELGFNRLVVDKVLNHVDNTVGGVYDRHSYDHEKRAALDAWANALQTIVIGEKRDKVVSLTAR